VVSAVGKKNKRETIQKRSNVKKHMVHSCLLYTI